MLLSWQDDTDDIFVVLGVFVIRQDLAERVQLAYATTDQLRRLTAEIEDDDDEEIESDDVDPQKKLYDDVKDFVIHTGIMSKESIMRNFQVSSSKADNFLATMVSEQVLMFSYDGNYVFGPAAISARQKEGL